MFFVRHHTRAYIHHLIKAREILAEVLLYTHNQHQLLRLFSTGREILHSGSGNVEYEKWIDSLSLKFNREG